MSNSKIIETNMKKVIITLLFLVPLVSVHSQELNATVITNTEQLPLEYQDRLINFRQQIEDYLNNTQFTGGEWEWQEVKCNFNIFFTSATNETAYEAQVVITSQRPIEGQEKSTLMLSIMDNSWSFNYQQNQAMYHNPIEFEPLTSFLDYYAFLIIGFDNDSYEVEGGTEMFNKALNVCVKGSASSDGDAWKVKSGSYSKRGIVDDLLSANFNQFRHDFLDYHYNGIDLYYHDKQETYESIVKMINHIEELKKKINKRSAVFNVFFDAKHGEMINYLKEYNDKSIFNTLQKIDVGHTNKYLEAMEE